MNEKRREEEKDRKNEKKTQQQQQQRFVSRKTPSENLCVVEMKHI